MQLFRSGTILAILLAVGCSRSEPTKQDRAPGPGKETDAVNAAASGQPMATSTAMASAEAHGNRIEGPRDQNMGRNFEGRLHWRVTGAAQPLEISYLSRAERGRLQLDRPGAASGAFDVLFAGDQAIVLDHTHRRYRSRDLNEVPARSEAAADVKMDLTSDRREVSGLLCYPCKLSTGNQKVDACVRGLPGPVDTDKLETLMNQDIPAWVEKLIHEGYLPVTATVSEGDRQLYKLELLQYSPDQVPENELAVPANYQKM